MPVLRVNAEAGLREIPFTPGASLRDLLIASGVPVRFGCGGLGICGRCLVRIEAGEVDPPTGQELLKLRPEQICQGIRLACRVIPCRDLTLTILTAPSAAAWRTMSDDDLGPYPPPLPARPERESGTPFGVAVDLGTTHIRLTLWDLAKGVRVTGRSGLNPQSSFGSDVMTRLMAACASRENAAQISLLARDAIGGALLEMAAAAGLRPADIGRVAIVGNSAMLALLAERNYDLLLKPACWGGAIDCRPAETASWCGLWGIAPDAGIELVQPLAGFVGSDLLAGILATRLTEKPAAALLIDFGTNSEIALWDGATLLATSAAGGPAFEGCGISCGMPAEPGAIWRVEAQAAPPGLRCEVIGGGRAQGVCGSGLVDIIANLRKIGTLNGAGRFARDAGDGGQVIVAGRDDLLLGKRDIDAFQRAKAAIGAGTGCLMGMAGMRPGELQRVSVCGAFGRFLNVPNAQAIGLLPELPADRFELWGNSALAGCESILFSPETTGRAGAVRSMARIINLAQAPEFEDLFIVNLYLRPLKLE